MISAGKAVLLAAALALVPAMGFAQDLGLGEREFRSNCAPCHGLNGKGDGPYMQYLAESVATHSGWKMPPMIDITQLARLNQEVFPSDHVYQVIDGRAEQKAHGPRIMPIWGIEYNEEAAEYYREVWSIEDPESIVKDRINALVGYIESLQAM